jgi:hypothetical protein
MACNFDEILMRFLPQPYFSLEITLRGLASDPNNTRSKICLKALRTSPSLSAKKKPSGAAGRTGEH